MIHLQEELPGGVAQAQQVLCRQTGIRQPPPPPAWCPQRLLWPSLRAHVMGLHDHRLIPKDPEPPGQEVKVTEEGEGGERGSHFSSFGVHGMPLRMIFVSARAIPRDPRWPGVPAGPVPRREEESQGAAGRTAGVSPRPCRTFTDAVCGHPQAWASLRIAALRGAGERERTPLYTSAFPPI